MFVHFFLLFAICIFGALTYNKKLVTRKMNRSFICISFFLIFLVQGLRSKNVGWDTPVYYFYYHIMPSVPVFGYRWEPLYVLLNKIANMVSGNPQMLFILASGIINVLLAKFCLDNFDKDSSAFWIIFLYVTLRPYFNSMNLLRQYLAIAVAIQSYSVLKRELSTRNYIFAALFILFGFFFHRTALILVLIPLVLSLKKVGIKELFFALLISVVLLLLFDQILILALRLFPIYRRYLSTDFIEGLSGSGYHYIIALVKAVLLTYYYINNRKKVREEILLGHEAMFCLLSIIMTFLRVKISFAVRIGYYFELPSLMFMAKAPQFTTQRSKTIIYCLLFLLGIVSFTYLLLSPTGSRGCSDYTFFWQ